MKNKISACLVVHNEEKVLGRCLESIKNVVDEIIIVHDGDCDDKSLDIAKSYNAKIFIQPFVGEAEKHRPFCFEKASGDWLMHIDADEYFELDSINKIKKLNINCNFDCYSFLWPYKKNYNEHFKSGVFYNQFRPCLFRKNKMFMLGITHQHPGTYGVTKKVPNIVIIHDHSLLIFGTFLQKKLRWSKIQALQTIDYKNAPKYNIKDDSAVLKYFFYLNKYPLYYFAKDLLKELAVHIKRGLLFSGFSAINIALVSYFRIITFYYYLIKLKYFN